MKKTYLLLILLMGYGLAAQTNHTHLDAGFDESKAIELAKQKNIPPSDIRGFVQAERIKFINERHPELKEKQKVNMVNWSRLSNQAVQSSYCPNSDFSMLNYSNWAGDVTTTLSAGIQYPIATWDNTGFNGNGGSPVLMNTDPNYLSGTVTTDRHVIMNMPVGALTSNQGLAFANGYDPVCQNPLTGLYELPMVPPGETTSIRMGSEYNNYTSEKLVYAISPSISQNFFTYQFAVVVNQALFGHGVGEQPAIVFQLRDGSGNPIGGNCGVYIKDGYQASTDTSFRQSVGGYATSFNADPVWYRQWHAVTVDLTAYIGQTVYAEFQTLDCIYSGHFCYAYVSAKCGSGQVFVSMCSSSNTQVLYAPEGFASYQWYGANSITPIPGANADSLTITNGQAGDNYWVDCVTLMGCTTRIPITLQGTSINVDYYNGTISGTGNVNLCNGNSVNLVASGLGTYVWSANAGGSTNDTVTVSPGLGTTTYTVIGTSGSGCVDTATVTVNVNPNPTITVNQATICSGDTATLTASGADTYSWAPPTGLSSTSGSIVTSTAATSVAYTVTGTANGCSSGETSLVTVNPTPTLSVGSAQSVCSGGQVAQTTLGSSAGAAVGWTNTNTAIGIGASGTGTIPSYTAPGVTSSQTGVITATPTDSVTGCIGLAQSFTIVINPLPTISGGVTDSATCSGNNGGVTGIVISGGTPGYSVQWYNDSAAITGATSTTLAGVGAGTYSVSVIDTNGCLATGTSPVFVVPGSIAPTAGFVTDPTLGLAPLSVSFTNTSVGASSYNWNLGNGTSTAINPSAIYTAPGSYTVTLITYNAGCPATYTATIIVCEQSSITVPNVFSPNGDNINDEFMILTTGMSTLQCDVFNRWGQRIYTFSSPGSKWNGTFENGNRANEGTYYFLYEAEGCMGSRYSGKGFLTLVR